MEQLSWIELLTPRHRVPSPFTAGLGWIELRMILPTRVPPDLRARLVSLPRRAHTVRHSVNRGSPTRAPLFASSPCSGGGLA